MSNKNSKMRGFYGDGSDTNDVVNDWFSPVESTPEPQYYQTDVIDNSWILQEQLDNERIAREQAQAEADRAAAEYQRYLEQLEAERQAQAYQTYLYQLEVQREAEAYELALQEEDARKERQRVAARIVAEQRAAEIEAQRVRDAEIAAEAEAERVRIAIAVAAAEAEALRLVAKKKEEEAEKERTRQEKIAEQAEADRIAAVEKEELLNKKREWEKAEAARIAAEKAEADKIAAEEKAAQAEADRLEAIRIQALADVTKDDELRKYKFAQEDEDRIKEENRILNLIKDASIRKSDAIDFAKKSYEEGIKLLKAQNELTIAMQKSFIDTIINF